MSRIVLALLLAVLLDPQIAAAQGREVIGWGRLFNNDYIGDGRDRWRTGSFVLSRVTGPHWTGRLPARPGEVLELRFRSETIAPASVDNPRPGDRRYVSILSAGLHTHFARGGYEFALGGDLVVTGPQTGGGRFQSFVHDILDEPDPATALNTQIPNRYLPTALAEIGRPFRFSPRLTLRPFVEAQAGAETFLRIGGDLHFGRAGQGAFYMRDGTTGHRYRAGRGGTRGFAGVFGADIAHVFDSAYLSEADGYRLTDARYRVRAGLLWQGRKSAVFYGLTWLGEEFAAQWEGQLVGSVRLDLRF